jgi:DNA primase
MCIERHVETDHAEDTFLDIIEKFLNKFLENRSNELMEKQRTEGLTKAEIGELHSLLSEQK